MGWCLADLVSCSIVVLGRPSCIVMSCTAISLGLRGSSLTFVPASNSCCAQLPALSALCNSLPMGVAS